MNFQVGLCIVILVAATSAERGDLKIYGSSQFGIGFLQFNNGTDNFLTGCFADQSFGITEGLIACRQLGFQRHVRTDDSISENEAAIAVLGNSSCTVEDTKLIDCMEVKFMDFAEFGQECINPQLICSNEPALTSPYSSEALLITNSSEGKVHFLSC
ncbi:uncharacterized protein LOC117102044 [Anneissia japonica]|uniref:uncharacterized protein LOC117102044 n=1 Tax=Anneissia japonica TaxID=1529436 RepID=UPI0014259694|nr:uncharacterized protein LOC117102044 [Anneissia japonica]